MLCKMTRAWCVLFKKAHFFGYFFIFFFDGNVLELIWGTIRLFHNKFQCFIMNKTLAFMQKLNLFIVS
jgi:hypothetical protein